MMMILHPAARLLGGGRREGERPMGEQLTIPGEPLLAQRLREAAGRDALGHALILSGQGDLPAAARFAAAAMECIGEGRPCGMCLPCRKVMRGVHPDIVTVTDPDHKNISVDVLRDVVADAYTLPNEGRRKVYVFPDCALLEAKAQNVLLKVVEDGPPHAAFLFCAANSAALLPTIRSRAVEWKLSPPEERAGADDGARTLCELLCRGQAAELAAFCAALEAGKTEREALRSLLSGARDLVAAGLAACYGAGGDPLAQRLAREVGRRRLSAAADTLQSFLRQCGTNVGVGHLAGALAVELAAQARAPRPRK